MNLSEIMNRKVAGVPVVYLAAGGVVILTVVAYRMRSTPDTTTGTEPASEPGPDDADSEQVTNPYDAFQAKGSVTAPTPDLVEEVPVVKTNSDWVREGATYAMSQGESGTLAYAALDKYVRGEDRSYDEQRIVDMVTKNNGLPPDSIDTGGKVGSKPAQKQTTTLPGRHTIKGENDNGARQLAQLYYNRADAEITNLIRGANPGKGDGPWPNGTVINLPAYKAPRYFTATNAVKSEYQLAKKNGISINQLKALNGGMTFPVKAGTKVRVG